MAVTFTPEKDRIIGQFWAELNVGNAKVKKTTANEIVTNGNAMYSIAGATFGIFSDQNCSNQIGTLTTNENGDTNEVEVTAGNCLYQRAFCTERI